MERRGGAEKDERKIEPNEGEADEKPSERWLRDQARAGRTLRAEGASSLLPPPPPCTCCSDCYCTSCLHEHAPHPAPLRTGTQMHARAPGPGDPRPAATTPPPPLAPRAQAGPSHSALDTAPSSTRRTATLASARARPPGAVSPPDSSSAENTAEEVREDSGGAGNETDVEDEDGMGEESPSTGDEPPRGPLDHLHHHPHLAPFSAAMYPFPSGDADTLHLHYGPMHYRRRSMHAAPPSSAEVLLSSATTESSASEADAGAAAADARPARPTKRHRMRSVELAQQPPLQHPRVPRLRRIGALGISVHSDSDPDEPNISGLDSVDRLPERNTGGSTSDVTRATDLGIDSDMLRKSHGDGSPATAAGGPQQRARKRRPVGDATFRGVVDELAVQSASPLFPRRRRVSRLERRLTFSTCLQIVSCASGYGGTRSTASRASSSRTACSRSASTRACRRASSSSPSAGPDRVLSLTFLSLPLAGTSASSSRTT